MEFSRQEYWSGLPLPSPTWTTEAFCFCFCFKKKAYGITVSAKSLKLCQTLCNPMDCSLPGSSVHGILQARILEWVGIPFLLYGMFPTKGLNPGLPLANSLPSEPPGKPKNTGVGSLSLLQEIFLTQESNQGLLNCRWFLYQLSYKGEHKLKFNSAELPTNKNKK